MLESEILFFDENGPTKALDNLNIKISYWVILFIYKN